MQHCVKSEIDVLRKEDLNVFRLVIYIRIGKWPKDEFVMTAFISQYSLDIYYGSIIT